VALTLVSATYQFGDYVRLTFDRAIDIGSLAAGQVVVDDGEFVGQKLVGQGAGTLVEPAIVQIALADDGEASGSDVRLTASAATGIAAADDGGTWAGVADLELPFP
jgi:hypothetical protein